jgi:hypothetical protein
MKIIASNPQTQTLYGVCDDVLILAPCSSFVRPADARVSGGSLTGGSAIWFEPAALVQASPRPV